MAIQWTCKCGQTLEAEDKYSGSTAACTNCGRELVIPRFRHDVFISYSTEDKTTADAACVTLEAHRLRCWVAPRDILPGTDWGAAIIHAIQGSRVMALIFSSNSNNSPHVMREVERAVSKGIPVIPFRIENVPTSKSMEYLISTPHWLDAMTPPLEKHLENLRRTVSLLLTRQNGAAPITPDGIARVIPAEPAAEKRAFTETPPASAGSMEAGAARLRDMLRTLLGPGGQPIALQGEEGKLLLTRSVSLVMEKFRLADPVENMVMQLVRPVAQGTRERSGDGAGTTAILAMELFLRSAECIASSVDPLALRRGMDKAVEAVVGELRRMSRKVKNTTEIKQVATIAANGDVAVGGLIGDAMDKVGHDGPIIIEDGKGVASTIELVAGMKIDRGYLSPHFVTSQTTMEAELSDAYVLIHEKRISRARDLVPALSKVADSSKPLLIIAEEVEGEALATLVVDELRGTLKVAAVRAPGFGDRRKEMLEDLAVFTGGTVIIEGCGVKLEEVALNQLGRAKSIRIGKDNTTITEGAGAAKAIKGRIEQIRLQVEITTSDYDRDKLVGRLATLAGGVAIISVGAVTEAEMRERTICLKDALQAARAAVEEGFVPGGGVAYVRCRHVLQALSLAGTEQIGLKIVEEALPILMHSIVANTGLAPATVLAKAQAEEGAFGFDAATGRLGDLLAAGVVDCVKTLRFALQCAADTAWLLNAQKARGSAFTSFVWSTSPTQKGAPSRGESKA